MTSKIAREIQTEQDHGRQKYGNRDHEHTPETWNRCIADHSERARYGTPMERRQELVKVAGLAVSAIEAFDESRKTELTQS